jgi:hypothetical protein
MLDSTHGCCGDEIGIGGLQGCVLCRSLVNSGSRLNKQMPNLKCWKIQSQGLGRTRPVAAR